MNCAVNRRQVVIALSGGELVYFEMDPVSFTLSQASTKIENEMIRLPKTEG